MYISYKINKENLVSLITTLFVFVVVIDPSDVIFKLKMPLFAILVFLLSITYPKIKKSAVNITLIVFGICFITSALGIIRGININWDFAIGIYKGFLMILLIAWTNRLRILERLYLPIMVIAIVVIVTYVSMLAFPALEYIIYGMTNNVGSSLPIIMSRREFIGIPLTMVFYKTSPLALFVSGIFLQRLINNRGKIFYNLLIASSSLMILFFSGTRMNILSGLIILSFMIIQKFWNNKLGRFVSLLCLFFGIIAMGILLNLMLSDKNETSLNSKTVLSKAFSKQVEKDPLLIFIGQGAGATFDSLGIRGKEAVQSELTYQDLTRWYGIPLTVVILLIYLYPIFLIYKKRKILPYSAVLILAYTLYIAIAGTNPLLITSTGMIALLIMYSYAYNPYYENKMTLRLHNNKNTLKYADTE